MRVALFITMSVLVAGCSSSTDGSAERATETSVAPAPTSSAPTSPPAEGAAIADVVRWVEAGVPADAAGYHSMTRDGAATPLTDGVAFTTAHVESNCVTNQNEGGALACLVKLTDPPAQPPGIESAWKNNWVDFSGTGVDVGSPHGDPGPFINGTGAELPVGQTLSFGDYRCRADAVGLFCVDYARQTAVKLSSGGVEAYGCLAKVTPPADIGIRFSC